MACQGKPPPVTFSGVYGKTWDRGQFSVPRSCPLICRAYLPFEYIPPFLCLSRARIASKHPEGVCLRGAASGILLCQIRWDREPSPVPPTPFQGNQSHFSRIHVPNSVIASQRARWCGNPHPFPLPLSRRKTHRGRKPAVCRTMDSIVPGQEG